ncbi:MAG: hypothetical protein ACLT8E_01160 [Akkermansia sp.]
MQEARRQCGRRPVRPHPPGRAGNVEWRRNPGTQGRTGASASAFWTRIMNLHTLISRTMNTWSAGPLKASARGPFFWA